MADAAPALIAYRPWRSPPCWPLQRQTPDRVGLPASIVARMPEATSAPPIPRKQISEGLRAQRARQPAHQTSRPCPRNNRRRVVAEGMRATSEAACASLCTPGADPPPVFEPPIGDGLFPTPRRSPHPPGRSLRSADRRRYAASRADQRYPAASQAGSASAWPAAARTASPW